MIKSNNTRHQNTNKHSTTEVTFPKHSTMASITNTNIAEPINIDNQGIGAAFRDKSHFWLEERDGPEIAKFKKEAQAELLAPS